MADFLCRSCGRRFPPTSVGGAPICEQCRLPTVLVPGGADVVPVVKGVAPAVPRPSSSLDEPRIIPAAKGREAARRAPTAPTRRETTARVRPWISLRTLIPLNLGLLLLLGLMPSVLLYGRVLELESLIEEREESTEDRTDELAGSIGGRLDELERLLRERGPLTEDLQAEEVAMLEHAGRAVLHIEQTRRVTEGSNQYSVRKAGSGFIYDLSGLALTNFHVIEGYSEIEAFIHNGDSVKVRVLGTDPASDIALLQITDLDRVKDSAGVTALPLGDSVDLTFGQFLYALGSPKSLRFSAARGIVSNPRRYQPSLMLQASGLNTGLFNNWIQTDAAINRGNSGGPLIDVRGRVVGVVTRKMNEAENIGFAIPIDDVKTILPALRRDGFVRRSTIGALLTAYKPATPASTAGSQVKAVLLGSPADRAGLRAGDILVELAGVPLAAAIDHELAAVLQRLAAIPAGEPARMKILRAGSPMDLSVTPRLREEIDDKFTHIEVVGCWVAPVEPALRRLYGVEAGAGVWIGAIESGSRLAMAGLQAGDLIVKIAGNEATRVGDVMKVTHQVATRQLDKFELEVVRGGTVMHRTLQFHFVEDD